MGITPFDLFLVFVIVVGLPLWAVRSWRRLNVEAAADPARARVGAYQRVLVVQWSLALLLGAHWLLRGHAASDLGLTLPDDRRGLGALFVALALSMFVLGQARAALRSEENRAEAREAIRGLAILLPHAPREYAWFRPVAWTAGICEELLFRGYLPWVFGLFLHPLVAWGLATVAFGIGHAYQGVGGIVKTTIVGAVFALLTWASGSILPAVVLHGAIDAINGRMAYHLLREEPVVE